MTPRAATPKAKAEPEEANEGVEVEVPDIAPDRPQGIYAKIAAIQREVGAIPKNGQGPSNKGGFSYIKAEDILDKVHSLLVKFNVIVVPNIFYTNHTVTRDQGRGYINATIGVEYEYIDVDDGSSIKTTSIGEGSDIGSDTATRKAATQAMKISHLHMFTIPNSEFDDEGYEPAGGRAEAKPTPPALNRASGKTAAGAPAKASDSTEVSRLIAQIKALARTKGVTSAQLNEMGSAIQPDFIESESALTALKTHIESL